MKIVRKILVFFCTVMIFFLCLLTMLLSSGKSLVTKENLSDFIKDAEILNMDINVIFNKEESGITLKDKATEMGINTGIPKEIMNDIMASEEINDILGDFFNKTIDYAINGNKKPQMSDETVKKMQEVANLSLENHINIMMEEEELNQKVEDYCFNLIGLIPNRNEIIGNIPIGSIRLFINFDIVYLYLAILLLLVLTGILSWSFYKPIKYLGIPLLLSGIIFVILGCMNNFIGNVIGSQITNFKALIEPLIINLLTIWFKIGVLASFSGVLLIIIYVVINRIMINNKNIKILEETRRINIEDINIK